MRLGGFFQDFRYAVRTLRLQPGHSLAVVLIMALGIGATTTLFSVTYGVLLKPLPWPHAERLIRLAETRQGATRVRPWTITNAVFLQWREKHSAIDALAAWQPGTGTMSGGGEAATLHYASLSSNLFEMLDAHPAKGSGFHAEDEIPEPNVIVLSYGLWQTEFGGAADVIGRRIQLDGKPFAIVGVMDRDFVFPDRQTRAWTPLYVPPAVTADGKGTRISMINAIARLRPGASPAQAAAEATAMGRGGPDLGLTAMAVFGTNSPPDISAAPALSAMTADVRPALLVFLAAVALLLITATANVASLQLARSTTRRREMAIRSAVGASASRLTRQLVVESALLGALGGIVGMTLVAALQRVLPALLPSDFPRVADIGIQLPVVLFAAGVTACASLACGLWPAVHLLNFSVGESLVEQGSERSGSGRRAQHARAIVMTGQVAIACILLIGAALLGRSFWRMLQADRGYNPTNVLTANLPVPASVFSPQRRSAVAADILERLSSVPGVLHAASTDSLQFSGFTMAMSAYTIPGRTAGDPQVNVSTLSHTVSQDYFATLGIRLLKGRTFEPADTANSPHIVLVNQTFERQYLNGDAVSTMLPCPHASSRQCEVVGVVADVHRATDDTLQAEVFGLDRQWSSDPPWGGYVTFIARTSGDPRLVIDALKGIVHDRDASLALDSIMSIEDRIVTTLAKPRLYAILLGGFAFFALTIAGVGLFGVLSYSVAQRSRELAVRAALGARPLDIVGLVVRQGLSITVAGLVIGVGASMALVTYLATFLYGITTRDTLTFVSVPVVVVAVAAAACIRPALRASRIDPIQTMRGN
jgi:putative ABC transport system permease protein